MSSRFWSLGSRAIEAHYQEQLSLVQMLIKFVDQTPILKEYVDSVHEDLPELNDDIDQVLRSFGRKIFSTGSTPERQVNYIYQLLKKCIDRNLQEVYCLGWGYTSSRTYQDMASCFGNRVILPFVNQVNQYMMDIATDMRFDEEATYVIHVSGGNAQVNIANDEATINAQQFNNQAKAEEIARIMNQIRGEIERLPKGEDREVLEDSLENIRAELKSDTPNYKLIAFAGKTMTTLATRIPQALVIVEGVTKLLSLCGIG